jgi:hypothetical protein
MTHGHQSVQSGRRIVAYIARVNLNRKVLDFDQLGGLGWARTIDLGLVRNSIASLATFRVSHD